MTTAQDSVTVRVPATTANVGPGFDTLGIALDLHNAVTVSLGGDDGVTRLQHQENNAAAVALAQGAADAFFTRSGCASRGVRVAVQGAVPISCGLGSSVTIRLGIVYGLNEIHDRPLTDTDMLELVTGLEGHPDNCAPALFGGFAVSGQLDHTVRHCRFPVPARLKFVGCVPDFEVSTSKARKLLPTQVPLAEAVENLNRVALITAAFASEDFTKLRGLFVDHLHQPYRKQLLPQLDDVIASGVQAGAEGGWLSGSGSTIMCLTTKNESAVADAMAAEFQRDGIRSRTLVLTADNDGTKVVDQPV